MDYSPWGCKEWDMTEWLSTHTHVNINVISFIFLVRYLNTPLPLLAAKAYLLTDCPPHPELFNYSGNLFCPHMLDLLQTKSREKTRKCHGLTNLVALIVAAWVLLRLGCCCLDAWAHFIPSSSRSRVSQLSQIVALCILTGLFSECSQSTMTRQGLEDLLAHPAWCEAHCLGVQCVWSAQNKLLSTLQWGPCCCRLVAKSCPTLWPHGLQHPRLPCPSPSPRVCSNSCPFSQWCHPTISSSVAPFSSCPQSFPASKSLPTSQLFTSGGQSIGASASVLPMNIQDWFPLGIDWLDLLAVQGTLKSLLQHHSSKALISQHSAFFMVQPSQPYMTTGKTIALTRQHLSAK